MKIKNTQKMKTTILTLLAIVALSFGSCKKTNITPEPTQRCIRTPENPNVSIHVLIESLGSNNTASLIGTLEFRDDSDTTNSNILLTRNFNENTSSKFTLDTTFNLNAPDIKVLSYLVSQTSTGIDNATDTQIKIWVNGQLKYWGAGVTILNQTDIK